MDLDRYHQHGDCRRAHRTPPVTLAYSSEIALPDRHASIVDAHIVLQRAGSYVQNVTALFVMGARVAAIRIW
jgi:hypothetical protein